MEVAYLSEVDAKKPYLVLLTVLILGRSFLDLGYSFWVEPMLERRLSCRKCAKQMKVQLFVTGAEARYVAMPAVCPIPAFAHR